MLADHSGNRNIELVYHRDPFNYVKKCNNTFFSVKIQSCYLLTFLRHKTQSPWIHVKAQKNVWFKNICIVWRSKTDAELFLLDFCFCELWTHFHHTSRDMMYTISLAYHLFFQKEIVVLFYSNYRCFTQSFDSYN